MSRWNDRQLPHPLLAPWTDDYGDLQFTATVPHAVEGNGKRINFTIKYHLTSHALRDLISRGDANYLSIVTCPSTSQRAALSTTDGDENVHVLDAEGYCDELLLSPYIAAAHSLDGFTSDELADEFNEFKPNGFNIPQGAILAVGEDTRITLDDSGSPESVIDLVSDPNVEDGLCKVDLEEPRIKIHVSPADKPRIEAMRKHGINSTENASLFPSIYLHAVTEALRNLNNYSEDSSWVKSIRATLSTQNIGADDEILKDDAFYYSQILMNNPIGTFLKAFGNQEEEQ